MVKNILYPALFILLTTSANNLLSQNITGEYYMQGGGELAAGFKFDPDSSFQFYFTYGAVDRTAKGIYSIHNGKVILHGDKVGAKDFTIKNQKRSGDGASIQITDANPALIQSILCIFKAGNKQDVQYSDNSGYAHSALKNCDTIFVMHPLYADVLTTIKYGNANNNNYFELTLNPSLAEVCFKNFPLTINQDTLTGSLPYLFEREKSFFIKQ